MGGAGGLDWAFFAGVPDTIGHRAFETLDEPLADVTRGFAEAVPCP